MLERWRAQPFVVTKVKQLWRLVRESHAQPMTGQSRSAEIVDPGEMGVTFIGHSSFLIQIGGHSVLVDPVFATRLILLRRQRRAGETSCGCDRTAHRRNSPPPPATSRSSPHGWRGAMKWSAGTRNC